jgi:hypothetical protein
MPIEPTKKVFEVPRIVKREENTGSVSRKKQKTPKKQKEGEAKRIDIRV